VLPVATDAGWLCLNLGLHAATDAALGARYVGVAQAWVTALVAAEGRFGIALDAVQIDSASATPEGGPILCPSPSFCPP
jgi:hypothetical protein